MLNLPQVAKLFKVSQENVRTWVKSGELRAIDVAPYGSKHRMYRFTDEAIHDFEQRRAIAPTVAIPPDREKITQFI